MKLLTLLLILWSLSNMASFWIGGRMVEKMMIQERTDYCSKIIPKQNKTSLQWLVRYGREYCGEE